MSQANIILASSSPYRRELLTRLQLPFECHSPDIDEAMLEGETPVDMVLRLAHEKADAVAQSYPDALIIASDQCAVHDHRGETVILGKPHTRERAIAQLLASSGQSVVFHTSVCVRFKEKVTLWQVPFTVCFRELSESEVIHYVDHEDVLNCAGSFKCEGLGIALFESMAGEDPNALIGLPLISLCQVLRNEFGIDVLG